MGSPLRFTIVADAATARVAWELVRRDVEHTEAALSRYRRTSALTRANRHAGDGLWHRAPRRLMAMAALVLRAHRTTAGTFDPRVVTQLESLGERAGIDLPTGSGADAWLEVDPARGKLRLAAPIDSGGIGKGLALRWALRSLRSAGATGEGGIIEAGGDLVTWGAPSPGAAWRVGIEDPQAPEEPLAVVEALPGAVATSSVRLRRWTSPEGDDVHHLIDPRTGRPAQGGLLAVTVAAPDPAWAEVSTKHLFIGGAAAIAADAEARRVAAWWVTSVGELRMSRAARTRTLWTRPDARPATAAG
jgi:thiamine biosynthesis lipoprotein